MEKRRTSIIGTGALGSALARALSAAGFPIAGLYNRHEAKAQSLKSEVETSTAGSFLESQDELGTLIFLSVSDRQIQKVAGKLSAICDDLSGCVIAHCSGNMSASALAPLQTKSAKVASFHPLQTFAGNSSPDDFRDIYIDMEGDQSALVYLKFVCQVLKSHPLQVDADAKPYLHTAAVMASNYLPALLENAARVAATGGMSKQNALKALKPLFLKSAQNISGSESLSDVLSGPVVRGDVQTVKDHLKLLKDYPELKKIYQLLGRPLVDMAVEDAITPKQKSEIKLLLEKDG